MEPVERNRHFLNLEERRVLNLTGVTDVQSFDEEKVELVTENGRLVVRGKELHVCLLQLEEGEARVEGTIDSLSYSDGPGKKKKDGSLLARLFQ